MDDIMVVMSECLQHNEMNNHKIVVYMLKFE